MREMVEWDYLFTHMSRSGHPDAPPVPLFFFFHSLVPPRGDAGVHLELVLPPFPTSIKKQSCPRVCLAPLASCSTVDKAASVEE